MTKILISDLIGTLIPDDTRRFEYFYSEGNHIHEDYKIYEDKEYRKKIIDKAFLHLGMQLNLFLEEGNYIKLVTSISSHESADFMFNEFITRFYEVVKEYKNQISIFLVGRKTHLEELSRVSRINQKGENVYVEKENEMSAIFLEDKTQVFDFVKKSHDLIADRLFAIGDSYEDIPMLFKCIELGGKSSLINNYLYTLNNNITTDSILFEKVLRNFDIVVEKIASELYPGFNDMNYLERFNITTKIWDEWKYTELKRLYDLLNEGKLDLNALLKEQEIYTIMYQYNNNYNFGQEKHKQQTIRIERMSEITMYPTFTDYCNKVLTKK